LCARAIPGIELQDAVEDGERLAATAESGERHALGDQHVGVVLDPAEQRRQDLARRLGLARLDQKPPEHRHRGRVSRAASTASGSAPRARSIVASCVQVKDMSGRAARLCRQISRAPS
jgi:hypothetical protein